MRTIRPVFAVAFLASLLSPYAFALEKRAIETEIHNDFVISPAKLEVNIPPGGEEARQITVANRHARSLSFSVSVEDFAADNSGNAKLLGSESGAYSLRDFIAPEVSSFILAPQEEITFSVRISVPEDASPGGLFGSVLVSNIPSGTAEGGATTISRLAALLFVRVSGDAREEGVLKDFRIRGGRKAFQNNEAVPFEIYYENTGNVHLNPYGIIRVRNMLGRTVWESEVDPYYAIPNSTRYREVIFDGERLFGRYTATLSLNRGYGNIIDEKSAAFWVIPVWAAAALFLIVILAVWQGARKLRRKPHLLFILLLLLPVFNFHPPDGGPIFAFGAAMSSTNYKIETDSVNIGGTENAASANYRMSDTIGEVGTGDLSSASYNLFAGYRQMLDTYIAISSPSNVALSPSIPPSGGGTGNGSAAWTVTTSNPAGYALTILASTNPALQTSGGGNSFANYTLAGASPDFSFSVAATDSEFGFTPEGADIAARYRDNGASCNTGALDTADACWDPLTVSSVTIASRTSPNHPAGTATTVKFRAESGASHAQTAGSYEATVTVTATAL